ncbi:NAD-dependent epimerase/dehydratase family protein [Patescibacteria group bacterium]|nr:NAD-dependent epimerase/dehydratase family protein [Patescibacteria group bacterium]
MHVLVTGGAGYLGSVLVPSLLAAGHSVTVLDILMFGGESVVPLVQEGRCTLVTGDIRSSESLEMLKKQRFGAVVHLAALVGEPACRVYPQATEKINHEAAVTLAERAKRLGVRRFIFTSTCSNYGLSAGGGLATETSPLRPLSLYAETKIAAERDLLRLNDAHFSVTILRLATLFGISPKMRFNLLINEMVREAWAGRPVLLYKEDAWRPYLHVSDAAEAIGRVLGADPARVGGQILNVGTENLQKKRLVQLVLGILPSLKVANHGGLPDSRDYRVSFEKIRKAIGFRPAKRVKTGISEIAKALEDGLFSDPYAERYTAWLNEPVLKKYHYA